MKFERLRGIYANLNRPKAGKPIPTPPDEHVEILKLNEVLSPLTRMHRRNLLIACSISLLLTAIKADEFEPQFILKLDTEQARTLAIGAFGLLSVYECVSFLAYGIRDLQAWKLNLFQKLAEYEVNSMLLIRERIEGVYRYLKQIAYNASTVKVDMMADVLKHQNELPPGTFDQLNNIANDYEKDVAHMKNLTSAYNKWGIVQLIVLDWALPNFLFWFVPYKTMFGIFDLVNAITR